MQIDEPRFLGNRLQRETWLTDTEGRHFRVAEMMGKPLILLLSYYGCDGTCPTMNAELAKVLEKVKRFQLGKDYRVLTVSFDKRDTVATAQDFMAKSAGVPEAMRNGWRHAVLKDGPGEGGVEKICRGSGVPLLLVGCGEGVPASERAGVLDAGGTCCPLHLRHAHGCKTIELAITDADWERISNSTAVFDIFTGACFSYNYAEGRYQWNYSLLAGVGSLLLGLVSMGSGALIYRRRMSRRQGNGIEGKKGEARNA